MQGANVLKTTEDARNEQRVAEALADLGVTVEITDRNGEWNPFDYFIYRDGRLVAIAELKSRRIRHDQYPDAPVSKFKLGNLLAASRKHGVPALFIVAYRDRVRWVDASEIKPHATPGIIRRTKPRASGKVGANDTEPGLYLPIQHFRDLDELADWLTSDPLVAAA